MTIKEALGKISGSPSRRTLTWIGAFVSGIAAATGIFPSLVYPPLKLFAFICLASAVVAAISIKNRGIRLCAVSGFLFLCGAAHYVSYDAAPVDLLRYFPFLSGTREWFALAVARLFPEPEAGFLTGLVVGGGVRSPVLKEAFVATGTAHVMALSGWNVGIISRWLDRALALTPFGKKARWLVVSAAIAAFVIMAGAPSSLVRAAVMSLAAIIALAVGRPSASGRALLYSATAMLALSPRLLVSDIGFILSVCATAGIVFLSPFFRPLADRLPNTFDLRQTAADTMGATVATLPVTIAAFGQISLIALPANLLLLPAIPFTIGIGAAAALLAGFFPFLEGPCRFAANVPIAYDISLVKLLSRAPGASVSGLYINGILSAAMAGSVILAFIHAHRRFLREKNRE